MRKPSCPQCRSELKLDEISLSLREEAKTLPGYSLIAAKHRLILSSHTPETNVVLGIFL